MSRSRPLASLASLFRSLPDRDPAPQLLSRSQICKSISAHLSAPIGVKIKCKQILRHRPTRGGFPAECARNNGSLVVAMAMQTGQNKSGAGIKLLQTRAAGNKPDSQMTCQQVRPPSFSLLSTIKVLIDTQMWTEALMERLNKPSSQGACWLHRATFRSKSVPQNPDH